jgi:xanthine dehydrogenase accessory factor
MHGTATAPVDRAMTNTAQADLLDLMVALRARPEAYALATVVETAGSASAKPGAKALIGCDGALLAGWVGGGCAESTVRQAAVECLGAGEPRIVELDLDDEVLGTGMPCGGSMRVFVEPVLPRPTLWVLGHGRAAECLCRFGATLGFRVVVDDTPAVDPARYPDAAEIIGDDYDYERLAPGPEDCVVIATQHKGDHLSAVRALRSPARYIAVIASRKRARLVLDFLRGQGFPDEELARVRAPAGLDLGARTPEEIALSVLSEAVMLRRGASGRPMHRLAEERARGQEPAPAPAREPAEAP